MLFRSGGGSKNYDDDARVLSSVFKEVDVEVIKAVLKAKNGSVTETIDFLKSTAGEEK